MDTYVVVVAFQTGNGIRIHQALSISVWPILKNTDSVIVEGRLREPTECACLCRDPSRGQLANEA